MTRIAVITPGPVANVSPLLPGKKAGRATDWEWYHRCLSAIAEVQYVALDECSTVSGFDAVLVHECLELATGEFTIDALNRLRSANEKLVWVEPHERTTFSATVFRPGFFELVDRVAKYQLMSWPALQQSLASPLGDLAPWALYGHGSIGDFYGDRRLFGLPTSSETYARHLDADLSAHYGTQIVPMMRLFTFPAPTSWYARSPSRQSHIIKEAQIGIALGNDVASVYLRGLLAGVLAQSGLTVKLHRSSQRAAATSEAFLAAGPVHLDGSAADVLRFDTLAVLPYDERYLLWDDVLRPNESFLPVERFAELMRHGGRVIDGELAKAMAARLAQALADADLRTQIIAGQRRAFERLIDPRFVAAKLGLGSDLADGAEPPQTGSARTTAAAQASARFSLPSAATAPPVPSAPPDVRILPSEPLRVGSISTDQISVMVQGAIGRSDLAERVVESARRHLPGCEVIVSTWKGERVLNVPVDRRIESDDPGAPWQVHEEWPANTNRLLRSTRVGLEACTRPYALKLRTDTPLSGTGFLETFQRYPERGAALRLLHDRIVVINYYCWNPERRPFGLFSVADTVNFGRTEDVHEVWDRPLDEEPANSTWFETHSRPNPDPAPWAFFRYTPEQLLWFGFVRKHVQIPFEHFNDVTPTSRLLSELSIANNAIIIEPDRFGVELPTFVGREPLERDALVSHEMWLELYERHCLAAPTSAARAILDSMGLLHAPGSPDATAHPLQGVPGFIVLADAEELLACEEMLGAYAEAIGGPEAVTLAIDASRLPVDTAEQLVVGLVERCGLDKRDDVALAAVVGPGEPDQRRRMLEAAHALYRRDHANDGTEGRLPVFTPASLDRLRELLRAGEQC